MSRKALSANKGFTIIETLIVLAAAGLILLIVLLAIPALQRNSRNNQRKQDVQAVLEAVSHYELNHSGNFLDCGAGGPSCYGSGNLLQFSHLTFYTDTNEVVVKSLNAGDPAPASTDPNVVYVYNHQKCTTGGNSSTPQGAGYGDTVAIYALESAGNHSWRCQQL